MKTPFRNKTDNKNNNNKSKTHSKHTPKHTKKWLPKHRQHVRSHLCLVRGSSPSAAVSRASERASHRSNGQKVNNPNKGSRRSSLRFLFETQSSSRRRRNKTKKETKKPTRAIKAKETQDPTDVVNKLVASKVKKIKIRSSSGGREGGRHSATGRTSYAEAGKPRRHIALLGRAGKRFTVPMPPSPRKIKIITRRKKRLHERKVVYPTRDYSRSGAALSEAPDAPTKLAEEARLRVLPESSDRASPGPWRVPATQP